MDWFAGVAEEELLYYTGVGNDVDSLWAVIGSFVPPPPRPPYLPEESIATDGLTTCDLCSWAWRNDRHSFSLDGTLGKSYIFRNIRMLSFFCSEDVLVNFNLTICYTNVSRRKEIWRIKSALIKASIHIDIKKCINKIISSEISPVTH